MPQSLNQSQLIFKRLKNSFGEDFQESLRPVLPEEKELPKHIPFGNDFSLEGLKKRRAFLNEKGISLSALKVENPGQKYEDLKGNIENFIGFCRMPVGVIGPLRVNGLYTRGDFYIPMATTEGALVASYNRGAKVISLCGGVSAMCLTESVSRAPAFIFKTLIEVGEFLSWFYQNIENLSKEVSKKTKHGKLIDIKTTINGSSVFLIFEFTTGDAAGQNMVTVATDAICQKIIMNSPVKPQSWYVEGNLSGDKKASMLSFLGTRGKKVVAQAIIFRSVIEKFLHTTPKVMAKYLKTSMLGGIQSGSIGVQGHFSNALAALFIACGQDAACVSEASIGITDMEVTSEGDLNVSVSLPNLTVGTVGGGTHLPTARECLEMIDCYGNGKAQKFAEICAATAMAGEVSIIAALASGHFTEAHATYRRSSQENK